MSYKRLAIILGNTLFPDHSALNPSNQTLFFMAEDHGLCTHFKYHKHKLILFLSAMRSHAEEIEKNYPLEYYQLTTENSRLSYEDKIQQTLKKYNHIEELVCYTVEDHFFQKRIEQFCHHQSLRLTIIDSPGFFNTIPDFQEYIDNTKRPFMQKFYTEQRKKWGLLLENGEEPLGGKWSYDTENRKKLPKDIFIPAQPDTAPTSHTKEVSQLVDELFEDHPGKTDNFLFATTRRQALYRLDDFLKNRFQHFGPYEDAIDKEHQFLFHSVLSPYINLGLITPVEVIEKALAFAEEEEVHLPSVEGFVRQIVGWREFMRGMYHTHDLKGNHFSHRGKLNENWYQGTTGVPPLDDSIRKVIRHGYAHHIERLMIIGNIMLLSQVHPDEVYRWFMELFVDSSDWVMEPNVYGMSQFADGGVFATKPYVGGANYIVKMSNYSKKGTWVDEVDGLYWMFIEKHQETFRANQRMSMMVSTLHKMDKDRYNKLKAASENFMNRNVI